VVWVQLAALKGAMEKANAQIPSRPSLETFFECTVSRQHVVQHVCPSQMHCFTTVLSTCWCVSCFLQQAEGAMDAANLLKPMLARGELRTIGATTLAEYRQHIEKDAAFERRFQQVST
jgi:hypothetical protein